MELGYDNTFEIIFQSTSPARGTTVLTGFLWDCIEISIHVPRKRDDIFVQTYHYPECKISIHVPRKRDDWI